MAFTSQTVLQTIDSDLRYRIIQIICQTLIYGIYVCLVPIAVHIMVTNGLQSRSRKWLLAMTTSMFALSTVHWIAIISFTVLLIGKLSNSIRACYGSDNDGFCLVREVANFPMHAAPWMEMFDDILLVNFIITDSIIVWRAWVPCSDQSRSVLMIPVVMLAINIVIYLITVTTRATEFIPDNRFQNLNILHVHHILTEIMNITEVAHLTFSLLINISATSIIGLKAWKYRRLLMESGIGVRNTTQAVRILALLVESGVIYILIGVMSLVSITIFLHFGFGGISDIFLSMSIQLAGIYPVLIVLLVEKKRSLSSTYNSFATIIDIGGAGASQTEPMTFASGQGILVPASGGHVDLTTISPNTTEIHVTFDSTLKPGDAGIGAGRGKDSDLSEEHGVS